jgi:hypothetical protein
MPGGVHIVLKGTHPVSGLKLVAVGYKYNRKNIRLFVATEGAGSTTPGTPYEMKFHNDEGNIQIYHVDRPDIVSFYYKNANANDVLNHLRQGCLKLEKKWQTKSAYFRLETTRLGICVVDAFSLASHHCLFDKRVSNQLVGRQGDYWTTQRFSGIVAKQLIVLANRLHEHGLEMEYTMKRQLKYDGDSDSDEERNDSNGGGLGVARRQESRSSSKKMKITYEDEKKVPMEKKPIMANKLNKAFVERSYIDCKSTLHSVIKNPNRGYDKRGWYFSRRNVCDRLRCTNTTIYLCKECNLFLCWSSKGGAQDSCFIQHIDDIKRKKR